MFFVYSNFQSQYWYQKQLNKIQFHFSLFWFHLSIGSILFQFLCFNIFNYKVSFIAHLNNKKHLNMKTENAYRHLKNLFCHLHGCKIPPYMFKIISCLHTMVLCLIYDSVSWIRVHHLNWYFKVWSHASKNIFIYIYMYLYMYLRRSL